MTSSFANETITRDRYPLIADMGTDIVDYTAAPASIPIEGCWPEPLEMTIDDNGRTLTVSGYRIAAPFEADVQERDLVGYGGLDYLVTGVQRVRSPSGRISQSIIMARRYEHGAK